LRPARPREVARLADRARLRPAGAALGIAGAAAAAWALVVEPRRLVVRRVEIRSSRWPPARPPLRLALVSDLHAGGPHVDPERVARIAERVNRAEPDVVLLLGDFVDHEVTLGEDPAPEPVARALGRLRAPLGTLAVLGNHDWRFDGDRVAAALGDQGIRVLENEAIALATEAGPVWFAGVGDARMRLADPTAALDGVPEGDPVVLLTHDPDVFPRVPDRVALTVAGHLHGGQVGIPVLRRRVLPSRHGERFARGHVEEGGRHLYVTQGVGESSLPFRLAAPPEVALVELRAA
jgi:predicted MPP superfamily phosphohydrolase